MPRMTWIGGRLILAMAATGTPVVRRISVARTAGAAGTDLLSLVRHAPFGHSRRLPGRSGSHRFAEHVPANGVQICPRIVVLRSCVLRQGGVIVLKAKSSRGKRLDAILSCRNERPKGRARRFGSQTTACRAKKAPEDACLPFHPSYTFLAKILFP